MLIFTLVIATSFDEFTIPSRQKKRKHCSKGSETDASYIG